MKEMAEGSEIIHSSPIPEGQPVYLQLLRGKDNQIVIMAKLIGLSEEESREGRPDPFKVIDIQTGKEVELLQRERLEAYQHPRLKALHIAPPEDLVRGLDISSRIKRRKRRPEPIQSLVETT